MFLHFNGRLVNSDTISSIDVEELVDNEYIRVHYKDGKMELVERMDAFHIVDELAPAALEGRKAKYRRHAWAIHNLLGHPLMQVCAWLHLPRLGLKIHDMTIPFPITK